MSNWALIRLLKNCQGLLWVTGVVCGLGSAILIRQVGDAEPKHLMESILLLGAGIVASLSLGNPTKWALLRRLEERLPQDEGPTIKGNI